MRSVACLFIFIFIFIFGFANVSAEGLLKQPVQIEGDIISSPSKTNYYVQQFDFKTKSQGVFHCYWPNPAPTGHLIPGSHWMLWVVIKNPTEYLKNHGYVKSCKVIQVENNKNYFNFYLGLYPEKNLKIFVNYERWKIKKLLLPMINDLSQKRFIFAVLLGDREYFTQNDWAVLRNTGTNHLMAIAGLHMGVVAWISYIFFWFILSLSKRLCEISMVPKIALIFSWGCDFFYSAMAGFSIPTMRALIMLSVYLWMKLWGYRLNPYVGLGLAFIIVLFCQPESIYFSGATFWLSFSAVFFLIYSHQQCVQKQFNQKHIFISRENTFSSLLLLELSSNQLEASKKTQKIRNFLFKIMYPQWVLWVGLLPISIYFFKQISWVSFIVNFLAVPFFSFIILPVLFFTFCIFCLWLCVLNGDLFFLNAIKFFFKFNNDLMTLLWNLLNFFSGLGFSHWNVPYSENLFTLFLGVLGSVFLLSPRLGFYRYFGLFGWFAMI